ncbi:bursicon-like [Ptychodera flava]|uniref:bursicon-like n=1 Tax=Ptychodera flava TaxID=63121 RepID=UPI00396A3A0C
MVPKVMATPMFLLMMFTLLNHTTLKVEGVTSDVCKAVWVRNFQLDIPNCSPVNVTAKTCKGKCRSEYIPYWSNPKSKVDVREWCTCCAPYEFEDKEMVVMTRCKTEDNQIKRVLRMITLKIPRECACRPCSYAIING